MDLGKFDGPWRLQVLAKYVHQDENTIGGTRDFTTQLVARPVSQGYDVFSTAKVAEITKAMEWSDVYKPRGTLEETYFVRIEYTIVATSRQPTQKGDFDVLLSPSPQKTWQYLVLARDQTGALKIIDTWPSVEEEFISVRAILSPKVRETFSDAARKRFAELAKVMDASKVPLGE